MSALRNTIRRSSGSLVKYRKSDTVRSEIGVGGDTVAETEHRDQDAIYGDPCICPPGDQGDGAETGGSQLERKSSRTRSTLRRITSFMRKDKSKNLSLVDTDGPASLKYSRYCPVSSIQPRVMIRQQTCNTC